jgi:ADP-ribose pyrophosphatase YjhB (NUDIX family)
MPNPTPTEQINFCVRCGTRLTSREVFGRQRPACPSCGWVYFADPKVAAGVLVELPASMLDGQGRLLRSPAQLMDGAGAGWVLLVRRVNEPARGMWSIPAGFVDAGEDPARAAERECLEETGLAARVLGLVELVSGREHPRGADLLLVYRAEITGGVLRAGDDADEARFFPRDALPPLAFRATRVALGVGEG